MTRNRSPARQNQASTNGDDAFRSLFLHYPVATWVYDLETLAFLEVNDAAVRQYGFSRDEWLGMTIKDLQPPKDIEVRRTSRTLEFRGRKAAIVSLEDITERKLAEQALRESEQRLRTIIETEPECVKVVGRKGELLEMNAAGLAMLEADSLGEAQRHSLFNFILPEYRASFRALHSRVMCGERALLEFEVTGLRGTRRWLETHAAPVRDATGDVVLLLGVTRDITERKRAERQSESERGMLELLARGEALPALLTRLALSYETMYPGMLCSVLLLDADGKHLTHGAAPSLPAAYCRAIDGMEIGPSAGSCGTAAYTGQTTMVADIANDPLWRDYKNLAMAHGLLACWSVPILSTQGRVLGTFAVYHATPRAAQPEELAFVERGAHLASLAIERQQTEAELHLQSAALNAAANSIVITDRNGTIEWVNAAFTALTGYRADEAIGNKQIELVKSDVHDQAFCKQLWDTVLTGNVWRGETTNRRKDGSLYPEHQTITPVKDDRGEITHFIAIKRDLTEERQLRAQFLQAQKMESVGQLAAGIAHDFNNLLTVINGTADLALTTLSDDNLLRTDLQDIHRAGERAAALTQKLLAFSRKQLMKPEVLNLSTVVAALQGMLQRAIGEDIDLVVVAAKELGSVLADPGQIEQVVLNLVVNARDAIPAGGTLTIAMQDVELDEAFAARHPSVAPGPHVLLAVSDTGVGMDEATRTRIFEPFFTTKEPGKGTGLGLSTAYGIVKQSGGSIWVESELGRGTTFKIYLPRVEQVAPQHQPTRSAVPVDGTETILIVEDEEALRRMVRRIVESAGYTVLTAANGGEALRLLERHDGPVHLMLTDVVMPGMSGPDLAARLVDIRPRMKVLYTSGYTDDAILQRGVLDAAMHFIHKPYATAELTRKVREVLDS